MALVWAVKNLRHHIYGRQFTVNARWLLPLQEFQFILQHMKGTNNLLPVALSRAPVGVAEETDRHPICAVQPQRYTSRKWAELQHQNTGPEDLFVDVGRKNTNSKRINSLFTEEYCIVRTPAPVGPNGKWCRLSYSFSL